MKRVIAAIRRKFLSMRETWFWKLFRNKYILTGTLFFIWLFLFDQNSLLERRKFSSELEELKVEKEYYLNKIEEDSKRLEELKTDNDNLEKFAREQYLMKKDNEDIFIIVDE